MMKSTPPSTRIVMTRRGIGSGRRVARSVTAEPRTAPSEVLSEAFEIELATAGSTGRSAPGGGMEAGGGATDLPSSSARAD
jgi:hypothetical protein